MCVYVIDTSDLIFSRARARASDGTRTAEAVGRAHGMFARVGRAMRRLSLGSARVGDDAAACARASRASRRSSGSGFRARRRSGTDTPRVYPSWTIGNTQGTIRPTLWVNPR